MTAETVTELVADALLECWPGLKNDADQFFFPHATGFSFVVESRDVNHPVRFLVRVQVGEL